jgi:cell division protein FtsL
MQRRANRYPNEAARRRKRLALTLGLLIVISLSFCYLFVKERVYTLRLADEHANRRRTVAELKERCRTLEYEVGQLSSLKRIEEVARQSLSLMPMREIELENLASQSKKSKDGLVLSTARAVIQTDAPLLLLAAKTVTQTEKQIVTTPAKASVSSNGGPAPSSAAPKSGKQLKVAAAKTGVLIKAKPATSKPSIGTNKARNSAAKSTRPSAQPKTENASGRGKIRK